MLFRPLICWNTSQKLVQNACQESQEWERRKGLGCRMTNWNSLLGHPHRLCNNMPPPAPAKSVALKGLSWSLPHILVFNVMPCSTLGRCYSSVHLHITYGAARHYQGRLMSSNPDEPDARKSHICRDLISCIFLRSFKPTFSISNFSNIYLCFLFPGNRQRILLFYSLKIEEIKNRKHIRPSAWMQCYSPEESGTRPLGLLGPSHGIA